MDSHRLIETPWDRVVEDPGQTLPAGTLGAESPERRDSQRVDAASRFRGGQPLSATLRTEPIHLASGLTSIRRVGPALSEAAMVQLGCVPPRLVSGLGVLELGIRMAVDLRREVPVLVRNRAAELRVVVAVAQWVK